MRRVVAHGGLLLLATAGVSCPGWTDPAALVRAGAVLRNSLDRVALSLPAEPEPAALPAAALAAGEGAPQGVDAPAGRAGARDEPAPPDEAGSVQARVGRVVDPDLALASIASETFVFASPTWGAKKVGYLRAGALVSRSAKPAGFSGCPGGWYGVSPEGFVCVGRTATLDAQHAVVRAAHVRPDREAALPYRYGTARFPTPHFYVRVPRAAEQARAEPDLAKHRQLGLARAWRDVTVEDVPLFLDGGAPGLSLNGYQHSDRTVYTGRALPKSGFAFLSFFESEGRRFGLSADLAVMPLDRLTPVESSAFRGIELRGDVTLPLAFVRSEGAALFDGDPTKVGLTLSRVLGYREAVALSGNERRMGDAVYLETRNGQWLRKDGLTRIEAMKKVPGWATPGRSWIDVSILKQTLVAYDGTTPVYATLVSTGADGLGDPKKTHSTVRGVFLIHTKHVTATMSGDEVGDEFDLRDVPWVQYFTEGYAFHAAYWHDSFGKPRSHGCVNLSPADARWLFHWTDPPVPAAWHGAFSLREGTLVSIHP